MRIQHRAISLVKFSLLPAIALLFTFCSPKTSHKVLSFFFDGAPAAESAEKLTAVNKNPSDTSANKIPETAEITIAGSIHQPYKENNCAACHNPQAEGLFKMPLPELCYTCHEDFNKKFAFVHGPVAGGYCISCHLPHSSELPKLLVRQGQALCLNCHDKTSVFTNEAHAEIGETNCTDCHNPHGGSDRFMF